MSTRDLRNDRRRHRYATDPAFRSYCLRATRNWQLKDRHGITPHAYEAQHAAQHGACAFCNDKLGRFFRVDERRFAVMPQYARCQKKTGLFADIAKMALLTH